VENSEGGNSGIFILAQELPNEPIYKSSPEMQILTMTGILMQSWGKRKSYG
jgi:hypothetical protein